MSDAVQLAWIGIVGSFVTGVIAVAIAAWAYRFRKSTVASIKAQDTDHGELKAVRAEYLKQMDEMREELRLIRADMAAVVRENGELRVTVARQEGQVEGLRDDVRELREEIALCEAPIHRRVR